ncbi:MAG: ClpXP protease specificity-enhancing factor [Gammaproteobacteria bacterium]|nr:ClpXP protease specificity-enhancing factor [Gammaproteobacteria bacterium]
MTSSRPYILRAMYEWIADNGLTPYILVNADFPGTVVPAQHIEDGRIVLNIAPRAVNDWYLDNDWLGFSARFSGVAESVRIPVQAVLAIYARENGKGMVFEKEEGAPTPAPEPPEPPRPRKPHLQVIK